MPNLMDWRIMDMGLVQWLKQPAWEGFDPHLGLQVSKKQKVSPHIPS